MYVCRICCEFIYVYVDMLSVHFQMFVNFNVVRPFFLGSKLRAIYCKWFKLNIVIIIIIIKMTTTSL